VRQTARWRPEAAYGTRRTAHVIHAVGNHLAEFLVLEVVGIDLDRLALRSIITAGVLEFSNQLLLLRVDRDYWLIGCLVF
jgi:hypothetical protein